jgi:hemerythrin-like domain-containing protein
MKITDALLGEHGVLYAMFDRLETLAPGTGDAPAVRAMAALLAAALTPHAEIENDLLFAAMEAAPDAARGPILAMREEHDAIEETIAEAADAANAARGSALLRDTIALARDHFAREEHLLFPLAAQLLGDAVLEELGAEWALRRHVALSEPAGGVAP